MIVAGAAFVLNLGIAWALGAHGTHHHDLNVRAAWIHMAGDAASSLAIIAGALIIRFTGWLVIDTNVHGPMRWPDTHADARGGLHDRLHVGEGQFVEPHALVGSLADQAHDLGPGVQQLDKGRALAVVGPLLWSERSSRGSAAAA